MAMHGRIVELVPAEGVGRIGQRPGMRGVLAEPDGAVAAQRARALPGSPSRCLDHDRAGALASRSRNPGSSSSQRMKTKPEMSVDPARSSSSRCSGVPPRYLLGQLLGDGLAEVAPGPAARPAVRPAGAGSASIRWMSRSGPVTAYRSARRATTGSPSMGVRRSRARPLRCRSVPSPSGQNISTVEVRRTEPGRRTGGATAGSREGGSAASARATTRHVRKSCFHVSRGAMASNLSGHSIGEDAGQGIER